MSIPEGLLLSDATTQWEMDTLKLLKESDGWENLSDQSKPKIIGPDRATAEHTKNVLETFSGGSDYIRKNYRDYVDIVGTQARYVDETATFTNYNSLSQNGLVEAWVTMSS